MENYTKEFKMQVVSEYNQCKDIEFALSKYGIAKSTLFYWIGRYKMLTDKIQYTIGDYIRLQNKYDKKLREFEIIEKAHCFKDSPRQQKLEAIESLFGQYPTKEMCRVLALPTGTFYNYRKSRLVETQYEKRDNFLKEQIKRVFDESEGRFSGNKICKKLKAEGIKVSELKVYELMKVLNIKPKLRKKRTFIQQEGKFKYLKNKLNRDFNPHAPNVSWVSDTTKLYVGKALFTLCVILDLFSRKVIAYRLSSQENTQLIINTFKDAFERRNNPKDLLFHSDRGYIYTSQEFRMFLHSLKVDQSFSKKGNPYDNAVIESFFACMKKEELNSHDFEYYDELKECVDKYIEFYNNYRPHGTLNNKTPNQFENEYWLGANIK